MYGYWCVHRRIYGLHAAKRCSRVFAVDVGHGQLAWKLRQDARVVSMEKTNIRYVTPEDIGEPVGFASVDVSFISLRVLPAASQLLKRGADGLSD